MFKQPVGYRSFHEDANFNFQLNRWLPYLPEDELLEAASDIASFDDWKRVMLAFGKRAEDEGRILHGGFYYRGAEFFMASADPDKNVAYDDFIRLFNEATADEPYGRVDVAYEDGHLPVMVVEAKGEQVDTLVVHGGFDSLAEELYFQLAGFAEQGFRVLLFEGPGQGAPLKKQSMPMIADWEKPVKAVLDHFGIESCTLMGISLGGCLATRAAAVEKRVKRVIANDALYDLFGCLSNRMGEKKAKLLGFLLNRKLKGMVNKAAGKAAREDRLMAWAVDHGMHVSGTATPFDYFKWAQTMTTGDISHLVDQDCLYFAATEDHLVPMDQFFKQGQALVNARSFTGRIFTAEEHASHHCHIGNMGLANKVASEWMLGMCQGSEGN